MRGSQRGDMSRPRHETSVKTQLSRRERNISPQLRCQAVASRLSACNREPFDAKENAMNTKVLTQILGIVDCIDSAIDLLDAMCPPWHAEHGLEIELEKALQELRATRETLKVLTTR